MWLNINKLHVISNDLLNLAYTNGFKKNVPYQKITPAIDTSFFINQSLKDASNKNLLQLMTIGRLHWKKDYTSIIIALKNLKDRGIDFEYTIIGDGPEEEKLKYLVYELGLINNIIFTGKISQKEILIYFKKSHFYLQYSLQEGFCNAVLEAQSMGVLPIVSNAEGLSENVLNNKTGWVIQKNSPKLFKNPHTVPKLKKIQINRGLGLTAQNTNVLKKNIEDEKGNVTGGWDLQELRSIQDYYVKYALSSASGVSEVASIGGYVQEYQVDVNPELMRQYNIELHHIVKAVKESNKDIGAQTLEINQAEYLVRGLGYVKSIEDIELSLIHI